MTQPLFSAADITQPGSVTRWLVNFLHVDRDTIVGCTEIEVVEIEAMCSRPLPIGYKQWLREAGRQVGPPVSITISAEHTGFTPMCLK